jgi:ribosome biogenesis GTPase / thiamine phosphate phosphatase
LIEDTDLETETEHGTNYVARTGIVLRVNSGLFAVQNAEAETGMAEVTLCTLRGNLRKKLTYSTSASQPRRVVKAKQPMNMDVVAVGDRVIYHCAEDDTGIIEEVLPRKTRFARSSFRGTEQTLVTNLDQLVIVFACAEPNPDLWRIDRWLISAEVAGIAPLLVANKRDKVDDATFHAAFDEFVSIGYTVLETCAKTGLGIEALKEKLSGHISAFTGPSGVGKSSLLNAIQPSLNRAIGNIGDVTFKGKHTTTVRELFPLQSGGWVADTPGLRSLEMLKMDREDLIETFVEFRPFLEQPCRYRNCKHLSEPGCVLKGAVESGAISPRRYESFLQLAREVEPAAR